MLKELLKVKRRKQFCAKHLCKLLFPAFEVEVVVVEVVAVVVVVVVVRKTERE